MCVGYVLLHGVNDSIQACRELGDDKYVLRQLVRVCVETGWVKLVCVARTHSRTHAHTHTHTILSMALISRSLSSASMRESWLRVSS